MKHKNIQKTVQEVLPINRKAKDTFFKTVYTSEERLRKLASVLLEAEIDTVTRANIRPVLFGNKENDLAFTCNDIFYVMVENQATVSPNIPYRLLEYITAALRSTVDSEQLLYGKRRIYFPIPKLYMLQTGLEMSEESLPVQVQYDICLSDSYKPMAKKFKGKNTEADLEVTIHVYDFRMTLNEVLNYIEQDIIPERFRLYDNDLRDYALVANGITYVQRAMKEDVQEQYKKTTNVSNVMDFLELMMDRNIFVDLLTDKEVCDMTMAQFSRDDIFFYSGREEGREEGKAEGKAEDVIELLEELGEVPDFVKKMITEQTDVTVLHRWLKLAAKARSIEDFEKALGLVDLER